MLPTDISPVHRLVSSWFTCLPPASTFTTNFRLALWQAATEEILLNRDAGKVYDPLADNRFKWAAQWLDLSDRCIKSIDPSVHLAAEYIFAPPPPLSRQHAAAGG